MLAVGFKKLNDLATLPRYANPGDAGMDLTSVENTWIRPGERVLVRTGLAVLLPPNHEAQVRPRSGLALKNGITVLNAPGTIDSGYRGEIGVILHNTSTTPFEVQVGTRIAQLVVAPVTTVSVLEVRELDDTERGTGGFGSSGTN